MQMFNMCGSVDGEENRELPWLCLKQILDSGSSKYPAAVNRESQCCFFFNKLYTFLHQPVPYPTLDWRRFFDVLFWQMASSRQATRGINPKARVVYAANGTVMYYYERR